MHTRTLAIAWLCGLLALPTSTAAQPCHPVTPELRAAIARVEAFLDEVDQPRPLRATDRLDDRTPVTVGGLGVHVMGLSSDPQVQRIKASVRRLAPALDRAIARLGGSVGLWPVYLIPFEKASYDIPAGGTTLAETRCYNQDTPVYGTADDPAVPGRACIVVVFLEAVADDEELDFALAHEWYHTIQHGSFPEADHTCRSAWWREGSADWFGHLVVQTDARAGAINLFFRNIGTTSLTDFSYEAQVFHMWAAAKFGEPWVFELGRRSDRELSSTASVSALMTPDDWREWAEAVADQRLTYPDGRGLPGLPAKSVLQPVTGDTSFPIGGPPLSVQLLTPTMQQGGTYQLEFVPNGALISMGDDVPLLRPWSRIDPGGERRTADASCARPSSQLAAIGTGSRPLAATVNVSMSDGTPCDACYYGTWEEIVERQPEDVTIATPTTPITMRHTTPGPNELLVRLQDGTTMRQRWTGPPVLTVNRDNTYTLDDPRVTTTYAADGQPLTTADDRTFREHGAWTPRSDGMVAVQRQRREVQGTVTILGTPQPWLEERRLRGFPIRYVPLCSAQTLELWLPPMLQLRALQQREPTAGDEPARPARVFRRR